MMISPLKQCGPLLVSVLTAVLLLAPVPASAFEYDEHCGISNDALALAVRRTSSLSAEDAAWLRGVAQSRCEHRQRVGLAFGDWVSLVDNALSPTDFYLFVRNDTAAEQFSEGRIAWDVLARLSRNYSQQAFAAHNNLDHFGDRGMFSFWYWHRAAMDQASRGNLGTALVLEAFGQHFLQDHFAPGHVRTPRRGLHDAASVGIHDRYNRMGAWYRPANVSELIPFIPPAEDRERLGDLAACDTRTVEQCLAWLETAGLQGKGLRLRGDGRLDASPLQRMFMVLVLSRSLGDVLDAYSTQGSARNHFEDYTWTSAHIDAEGYVFPPTGSIRYGAYAVPTEDWHLLMPRPDPFLILTFGYQAPLSGQKGVRYAGGVNLPIYYWPGTGHLDGNLGALNKVPQMMLQGGVEGWYGNEQVSVGPNASLVVPVAPLGIQATIGGGPRWLHRAGTDGWHLLPHGEARVEMGFALAFLGVGVSYDGAFDPDGHKRRGFSLVTTLTPMIPIRR